MSNLYAEYSDLIISSNSSTGFGRNDTINRNSGFWIKGNKYYISNNIFSDHSKAVRFDYSEADFINNIIVDCYKGVLSANEGFPLVSNNTFLNLVCGFEYARPNMLERIQIKNNIIAYCDTAGIWVYGPDEQPVELEFEISHNLLYGNTSDFINVPGDPLYGEVSGTNANNDSCDAYYNIFLDPHFTDIEGGNYHLTEFSPCIDAGIVIGLPFACDAPDIGAFEYGINAVMLNQALPTQMKLLSCYPNPFNCRTSVRFSLSKPSEVMLELFDNTGRSVSKLLDRSMNTGNHNLILNEINFPYGCYYVRLSSSDEVMTQKIQIIK